MKLFSSAPKERTYHERVSDVLKQCIIGISPGSRNKATWYITERFAELFHPHGTDEDIITMTWELKKILWSPVIISKVLEPNAIIFAEADMTGHTPLTPHMIAIKDGLDLTRPRHLYIPELDEAETIMKRIKHESRSVSIP